MERLFLVDTMEIVKTKGESNSFKAIYLEYYDKYLKLINKTVDEDDIETMFDEGRLYVSIKMKDKSALVFIQYEEEYHTIYLKFIDIFRLRNNRRKYVAEYCEVIDL